MKRKFRKILIGAGAFLAMTSVTFAGILQTSDSIAEEKLDSPKALFTANGKFTVTENVAGSSVQDLGGDVLFPSESRTGCLLTATEENTILFNKKFSGVFEMDFRSWSDKSLAEIQPPKTVTDPENPSETIDNPDYFDAYWSNYDDERLADAYNLREAQITFDDGENYFTIHTYAGGSNGFSCMASAGVSINGGDVYSIFYNDSTGDIMSHRSNSYKTQMYGVSMGQSARSYGTYPTLDKSLSTKIGFDPMTMQAYCYGYAQNNSTVKKYVVWELAKTINKDAFAGSTFTNDEIRTLSDFGDEYSVSFSFADIADGKEARALVYSVCGQSLAGAGEFATDNGPSLAVKEMSLGVVGTERNMKDAVLASNDFFEGKSLEFNGIVDVTLPNGEKESLNESTGYFYTPKTAGVYQLSYSAKDGKGNVGEPASVRWTVLEKDLEEGKPVPELFEVGANVTMTYDFDSPDYMYLYRGVKMSAHKDGSTISFKNPLELQKDVPLIEFAALTSQIGKYDFSEIEFKITDANDPNVYVTVYYNFSKWGNYLANVSAGLNGGLATGWNYDKKVMQAKGEGGFSGLFSFTGEARTGETCSLYFDNQESAVVISPTYYANNKTVIDFNSSRCIESEQDYWNGFESGSVYLSITLRGLTSTATPAELFISKINGQSLYGSYLHDSKAPVIQIDTQGYDAEQLPHAEVGKAYSVFQAFAIDEAIGEVSDRIVCKAFYDYGKTTQREIPISDGKFVPDEAGKITVEYSAVDDLDNKGVKTLTVTA